MTLLAPLLLLFFAYFVYSNSRNAIWPALTWISVDVLMFLIDSNYRNEAAFTSIIIHFVLAYAIVRAAYYVRYSILEPLILAAGVAISIFILH